MVRIASHKSQSTVTPAWHEKFLVMLPAITRHARIAFRHFRPEAREEAVQEVVCNACRAYARLIELGKANIAYATVLARFAVAQFHDGRRVGCKLNVRDVSSEHAKKAKGIRLERLDHYDTAEECWNEVLIEDKTTTPAELAATRIDFPAWLNQLSRRDRKIAMKLATGESTGNTARKFRISEGRVSQLRRELAASWKKFTGEADDNAAA